IDVNGNVVSQDTMNLFTSTNSDPGIVHMSASNSEVHAYNVTLNNTSDIEFDLNKEDAMPPTLTILRVIDQDGKENINVLDLESSKIEIAAGDFSIVYDEYNNPYKMLYTGKPSIEVYWTTDGQTYTQLEASEKENMFHVSYGNFFEVSLAPLTGLVNDQWVSLKIVVTDEAGNFQRQELTPLFYVGDIVGLIEKPSINALSHSVYPNPFSKTVTIKVEKPINGNAIFEIYDAMGKIISQRTINCIGKSEFTWEENVNTGMYFYKIYTNEGVVQGKFVKQE
ncbi:MAG: T9SS type A sorting domain-containing protein, partial [Bacteroidales bacterium]|nr:T9SS type A sorting domain-containing protein [Bacteroidales bacterium]